MSVEQSLAQFQETESQNAFSQAELEAAQGGALADVTIQAKLGSMVAYQGDVKFEHAGSGGMKRMLKKAVTSEGANLMKVSGQRRGLPGRPGAGHPPDQARGRQDHGERLQRPRVRRRHRLGHQAGRGRLQRARGRPLQHRARRHRLGCARLRRPTAPDPARRRADFRRPAGRDHLVERREHLGQDRRERQDAHRPWLGRDDPDRILRQRLAPDPAVRGTASRGPPWAAAAAARAASVARSETCSAARRGCQRSTYEACARRSSTRSSSCSRSSRYSCFSVAGAAPAGLFRNPNGVRGAFSLGASPQIVRWPRSLLTVTMW